MSVLGLFTVYVVVKCLESKFMVIRMWNLGDVCSFTYTHITVVEPDHVIISRKCSN